MAGRFAKQQRRKKWSEAGTEFPAAWPGPAPAGASARVADLFSRLAAFRELRSTFGEQQALRGCAPLTPSFLLFPLPAATGAPPDGD